MMLLWCVAWLLGGGRKGLLLLPRCFVLYILFLGGHCCIAVVCLALDTGLGEQVAMIELVGFRLNKGF